MNNRYPVGECNKLGERKVGPYEVLKKINDNTYKLKLPKHLWTSNMFNVKHMILYIGDSSGDKSSKSRTSFFQPEEDDIDTLATDYLEKPDWAKRDKNRCN